MKHFIWILFLVSCGDSTPSYTWGDASEQVSVAWCGAEQRCFGFSDGDTEKCEQHLVYHLCELDGTCDAELPTEAEVDVATCAAKLSEAGASDRNACFYISFGVMPYDCDAFWGYQP